MLLRTVNKNNFTIISLALTAGLLIAFYNFSVILLLILVLVMWFILEKFEDALLLLVFYLPFQVALNLTAGFDVASGRALILLFFIIWIFRGLKNKKIEIDFSLQTLLLSVFLFLAALSLTQSFEMDRAFRKLLVFYSVFPLYFVLTSFACDRKFILRAVRYLFVGALVISIFGLAQFFAQFCFGINPLLDFFAKVIAPVFYGNTFASEVVANLSWLANVGGVTLLRAFAIFPDPHVFSFYLGLIIPLVFALMFLDKDSLKEAGFLENKRLFYLIFITLILAELFTFSRGGYLGMAASFFVMMILLRRHFTKLQKRVLLSLAVFGMIFISFVNTSILTRFLSSFDLQEGSNVERMKNWQQGWDIFSNNFITGIGIGNYSFYMDPTVDYRTPIYAHNLYLDLGAELGIFALFVWVLLIAITILELYRASKKTQDKTVSYLALGLIGSLVWYSAHSFFDDSIYAPNILSMLVVIISLSVLVVRYVKMER
jgi:O-antigen ligase